MNRKHLVSVKTSRAATSVKLDPLLWAAMQYAAHRDESTISDFVEELLEEGLKARGVVPTRLLGTRANRDGLLAQLRAHSKVTVLADDHWSHSAVVEFEPR